MKNFFLLLAVIGGLVPKAFSAELSIKPSAQENRFLFVIDTSLTMSRSAKAVRETLRELIESGMQGQMHSGDTFGLWTFNEKLDTTFPMQRWIPGEEKKLAQLTVDFLKKRRYEKKSQLRSALPTVYQVMQSSESITVILISNGGEPIQGTPFDKEINAIYPFYVRELHDAKLAFVTVLVGRNGKPVAYSVNSSLSPIQIPQPPIEQEKIAALPKTNSVVGTTNRVRATNQIAAPKPKPKTSAPPVAKPQINQPAIANATAAPKIETKPETKTNEVVAIISTNISTPITAPKSKIPAPPVKTNLSVLVAPEKIESPKTASESSVVATVHAPNFSTPQIEPSKTIEAGSSPTLPTVSSKAPGDAVTSVEPGNIIPKSDPNIPSETPNLLPIKSTTVTEILTDPQFREVIRALEQRGAPKATSPAVIATTQPVFTPQKLLLLGATLLLVAGVLIWLLVRNSRKAQPSLISRSIDKSK